MIEAGYAHPLYAESLSEFGKPLELRRCGGWVLKRNVPNTLYFDAMGCYPLFSCADWSKLREDLEDVGDKLVSVALVADPFGDYDAVYLKKCFEDIVIPFKEHFVVDLGKPIESFTSKHHRYYARKALKELLIERCQKPLQNLEDWMELYSNLIVKHGIKGVSAFSRRAFEVQFGVPGFAAFRAMHANRTVGMILWYVCGDTGYWHLGAFSDLGYKLNASYALMEEAIDYFASIGLTGLLLGGGAGVRGVGNDGLTRFKKGWATGTKTTYFCGRIFDRAKYDEIVKAKGVAEVDYFPAYRKGEFS
jgi:hypothetical protein